MKNLNKNRITGIFVPFEDGVAAEFGIVHFTKKLTDEDGEETLIKDSKPWSSKELLEFGGAKTKVIASDADEETKAKAAKYDALAAKKAKKQADKKAK